jgi:hypothetical protein
MLTQLFAITPTVNKMGVEEQLHMQNLARSVANTLPISALGFQQTQWHHAFTHTVTNVGIQANSDAEKGRATKSASKTK